MEIVASNKITVKKLNFIVKKLKVQGFKFTEADVI